MRDLKSADDGFNGEIANTWGIAGATIGVGDRLNTPGFLPFDGITTAQQHRVGANGVLRDAAFACACASGFFSQPTVKTVPAGLEVGPF